MSRACSLFVAVLCGLCVLACTYRSQRPPPASLFRPPLAGADTRRCAEGLPADSTERCLDLVIVLDVSKPSLAPKGTKLVPRPADEVQKIFYAQMHTVERARSRLDPERVAIGLVAFAGEPYSYTDLGSVYLSKVPLRSLYPAWTEVGLTNDFDLVGRGLGRLLERGPTGYSSATAGIDRARMELLGTESETLGGRSGFISSPREVARKIALVFLAGVPALSRASPGLQMLVVREAQLVVVARQLGRDGIELVLVEIGPVSEGLDPTLREIAQTAGGAFLHVSEPEGLEDAVLGLPFVDAYDRIGVHASAPRLTPARRAAPGPGGRAGGGSPRRRPRRRGRPRAAPRAAPALAALER